MKTRKSYVIIFFTISAILVNFLGRMLADSFHLPIWCDSIGTFLMAYVAGPVCGAMVGFANNIIYGIFEDQQSLYFIVGTLLGIIVGVLAKKKLFESPFYVMTLGMVLAIFSALVSVVINLLFYGGTVGNEWGDQMMLMCTNVGIPRGVSCFIGQFYVEFLDKLISVEIIYLLLRLFRFVKGKRTSRNKGNMALLLLLLAMAGAFFPTEEAKAKDVEMYSTYTQSTYANQEGLLAGEANDITQTKDGKLWIGTYAGLYKYDGVRFTLFQDIRSIKNVNTLFVDEEGRLWVGTNDNGITILINEHVMNVFDKGDGLPSDVVRAISCDSNGNYYVGTADGLALMSLKGGVKLVKSFPEIKSVISLTADGQGNVVAVTERNKIYWLNNGNLVDSYGKDISGGKYTTAYFTQNGKLVLGTTDNQVMIYSISGEMLKLEKEYLCKGLNWINSFYETEGQQLFICSDSGIGFISKDGTLSKLNTNHFSSSIDNMTVDYQGNLWFCSSRLGLLKMSNSPFVRLFPEIGTEETVTNAVEHFDNFLFCGTDNGLVVIDEVKQKEVHNKLSNLLKDVRVRCLNVDSRKHLWVSTTGKGVYEVERVAAGKYNIHHYTQKEGMPGDSFRHIIEASDGTIIISGDSGVAYIRGGQIERTLTGENGLVNEKALCLLENNDVLYIGSDGSGIFQVVNGKVLKQIGKADGLSSGVILRMIYDERSKGIFIVTSNGLCYMSMDGRIQSLKKFPYSNNFDMIMGDNGSCWILSSAGVYVADVKTLIEDEETEYILLNSKRGLSESLTANSWNHLQDGMLYLCSDNGVVKVNMSEYELSGKSYRMILNQAVIDGVSFAMDRANSLTLSADAERMELRPEILNYSLDDPYVSYYLEGYEQEEKIVHLSELETISYSNLRPGEYTFHISVLDHVGGTVVETGSYHIVKETEMYQKWWFKIYTIVIAALVIIWITWFITRTQSQKTVLKQRLELEYAKKQIKMSNEMIISIARTVDAKDSNTSEHSYRVSEYAVAIAKRKGFDDEQCKNLRQMALLHDIGKIAIPDEILKKPSKLTDEEYEIMKTHVLRGGKILKDFTMIKNVNIGALYHHERYDGTGYCHGLKGEEIPLEARIIGIADAFDAMTANRVYRKQLDIDFVIQELKRGRGTQFDPSLVDIMLSLIEEREIDVEALYDQSKSEEV